MNLIVLVFSKYTVLNYIIDVYLTKKQIYF